MSVKGLFRKAVRHATFDRWMSGVNQGPIVLISDQLIRRDDHKGNGSGHLYTLIGPR
ncbi:MAG: hypothetical protein V3U79_05880 [Dehalococcoidia bacterium]